jgi:hypothetical protein
MFLREPQPTLFFIRNDNFYGRERLLLNVILSQPMCYKYSSKTPQKSLSRDSKVGSWTGNGTKIFLLTGTSMGPGRDRDRKRLVPLMSRFKASTKGIYQSDNIKMPKQKKVEKENRSERILQHPRSVTYRKP